MEPRERSVTVNGEPCRVWEKGVGSRVGYLAGLGGLPRWTPFLDRLADRHRVIAPSLPGFPGARGHDRLDDVADWIAATLDLLEAADLEGADLIGASVGGMLAGEVAAFSHATVRRLVLLGPLGLFDASEPTTDLFARRPDEIPALLATHADRVIAQAAPPAGTDELEWSLTIARASQASARLLWPLGDRGLSRRLHRVVAPTLVLWGTEDRIVPPSYVGRFATLLGGPVCAETVIEAGHLLDLDEPERVAQRVSEFLR